MNQPKPTLYFSEVRANYQVSFRLYKRADVKDLASGKS